MERQTKLPTRTNSDRIVRSLVSLGVRVIFTNPGTSEVFLVQALLRACDTITSILVLHETVAAGAADGYYRITRRPAATLLHLGVGLMNALSQLHNAQKAQSRVVNVIGDMSTWHRDTRVPLATDLRTLAATVGTVVEIQADYGDRREEEIPPTSPLVPGVTSLLVPHDVSWKEAKERMIPSREEGGYPLLKKKTIVPTIPHPGVTRFVTDLTAAIRSLTTTATRSSPPTPSLAPTPQAIAFWLHHQATISEAAGGYLDLIDALVRHLRASGHPVSLYCSPLAARVDRGAGRPVLDRLPYWPEDARRALSDHALLICVDGPPPIAMFGYPDNPGERSWLADGAIPETNLWEISGNHVKEVLEGLLLLLLPPSVSPSCDVPTPPSRWQTNTSTPPTAPPVLRSPPPLETKLTATVLGQTVAACQRAHDVIVDEAITSSGPYWHASHHCPPFIHLGLTGGAIGSGPCLAVGAGVALRETAQSSSSHSLVLNLQGDGSLMYSLPALQCIAAESLPVVSIVYANRSYAIIALEMARQTGIGSTKKSTKTMTQLTGGKEGNEKKVGIDFVEVARGMGVVAGRATTVEEVVVFLGAARERAAKGGMGGLLECVLG